MTLSFEMLWNVAADNRCSLVVLHLVITFFISHSVQGEVGLSELLEHDTHDKKISY